MGGRIQIKLGYDPSGQQLVVTIIGSTSLTVREDNSLRNPYTKVRFLSRLFYSAPTEHEIYYDRAQIFLMPDRSEKAKRRTKTLPNTCEPRWGQIFRYSGFRRTDLANKFLEISVWDCLRYGGNDFLGMILLDVGAHPLDDETEWYTLRTQTEAQHGLNVSGKPHVHCQDRMPRKWHIKHWLKISSKRFCFMERWLAIYILTILWFF